MTESEKHDDHLLVELADRLGRNQVFGEPVRQGDTTLVPVASVRLGRGREGERGGEEGGGTGVHVRPVGAFEVCAKGVAWHPAVSVNRIVWGGQVALAVVLVAFAIAFRRR
ncbi:hypothetical protein [Saccharopolyspora sp. CA-218241]|uniref:hypothetical protein n=1 Tax=Saccharopolyspora sp. CA-218241 TaxID=3240027 RepID=UPI003D95AD10